MQIILLERVINLGQLGDVVKVKEGYARNFLIPQGKARRATDAAIKEFEARRADLEKAQADRLAAAQAEGAKLNGNDRQDHRQGRVDGRLFGSVTNYDISEALTKQGFQVNKAQIRMRRPAEGRRRAYDQRRAAHGCRGGSEGNRGGRAGLIHSRD